MQVRNPMTGCEQRTDPQRQAPWGCQLPGGGGAHQEGSGIFVPPPPKCPRADVLTKCSQHQCVSSQYREGGFGLETSMR